MGERVRVVTDDGQVVSGELLSLAEGFRKVGKFLIDHADEIDAYSQSMSFADCLVAILYGGIAGGSGRYARDLEAGVKTLRSAGASGKRARLTTLYSEAPSLEND